MTDLENTYICDEGDLEDNEWCKFDTTIDDFSMPKFCPFTGGRCVWKRDVGK